MVDKSPNLLVQVLQFIPWELKLSHLRQYGIPPSTVNISNKRFDAVYTLQYSEKPDTRFVAFEKFGATNFLCKIGAQS